MKQLKNILGVTLLEIMLVLAIAAMIIVMSVRYYQTATSNQQQTALMAQIQAVTAAADQFGQGASGYEKIETKDVAAMLGSKTDKIPTPWTDDAYKIKGVNNNSYNVEIEKLPAAVCLPIAAKLSANPRFGTPTCSSTGGAAGTVKYTYDITK